MNIKAQIEKNGTPKVVEAFVAGQFVATQPELQYLHTEHATSMSLAFVKAVAKS